ncbi:MAG: CoA transferase [Thermoanaerobaculia bacterium]
MSPASGPSTASRRPPLEGILVLDLSRVLAGPVTTMALADMGARVIKVESPRGGDVTRQWTPPVHDGESAYFLSVNRRKESVAVDLDTETGREFVRRWARKADVVVENFLPGALASRGLSADAMRAENPRLIVCTISGAGDAGPLASAPGFDLLAQGASGLMAITGPAGGEPHKVGVALADVMTGWTALAAVLAALVARERDGCGAHVKTDLFSSALSALVNVAQNALVTGKEPARHGNAHPSIEPYRPFAASDAKFLVAVGTDAQFRRLAADVLHSAELAQDRRFETSRGRIENREELVGILDALFSVETRATWLDRCGRANIPAGPIAGVREALLSPQAQAIGSVLVTTREGHAPVPTVRAPFRFLEFEEPAPLAPPRLDEDGDALFAEVGMKRTEAGEGTPSVPPTS